MQAWLSSALQIVAAFPDGWLSSGQISREGASPSLRAADPRLTRGAVSVMKKKYEKEVMENDT